MRRLGWLTLAMLIAWGHAQEWVSETLQGRGVVGPYTLSWNNLAERSEIVLRGERWLVRERDYWIDYATGQIRFAEPLRQEETARVGYRFQPGRSQKNSAPDIPLSTELVRFGAASLSLQGRVLTQQGAPQTDLGLRATWEQPHRQAEALYLMRNPRDDRTPALFRLGSRWNTPDGLTLNLQFSRVDAEFGDARPYGLSSGQEQANAQLEWRPDRFLRTRLQWRHQRALQNPLQMQQGWLAGFEYALPTTRLQVERQLTEQPNQPASQTDRLALSVKPHEQIRLRVEERMAQQGERQRSQTETQAEIGQAVQLSHMTQREGGGRIEQSRVAVQGGTQQVQGRVELSQRWQQEATQGAMQAQLQAQLHPALRVSGEYQIQEQAGQLRGYQLVASPFEGAQLRLSERLYEGWSGYHLRSQQLEWEWRTPFDLMLGGQFARHPLQQGRPQPTQVEGYRLRFARGDWAIEAGYAEQEQLAQLSEERRYTLSLQSQLNPATRFALTVQRTEWERDAFLREVALRLGLTHRLRDFYLMLEASAQLPRADQSSDPNRPRYSGSLKLGVQF
ncbi:MAG: hypothetical protein NZL85_08135 [Fimbriimonadales bacterium]|nr:hypothetical protein [Fimbriimonadales bacterium]